MFLNKELLEPRLVGDPATRSRTVPQPIDWSQVRRLLVIRLDNIGDVILLGPALRSLKKHLPSVHLTLLASPAGSQAAPLLPWIDEVWVRRVLWQDLGRLEFNPDRELELVASLRAGQFDMAIAFTSFSQTPHPAAFVCRKAGIMRFAGQSKEQNGTTPVYPSASPELHQAERNLYLLDCLGLATEDRTLSIEIPSQAYSSLAFEFRSLGLSDEVPYIAFNPWASCPARTFPADRLAHAAKEVADRRGLKVLVTGLAKDRPSGERALRILGNSAVDLMGRTDLLKFAALISRARLVLTSNTSALHLTDAARTPVVVLYSGTDLVSQWAPRFTPHRLLRRDTTCTPCYAFDCPFELECLAVPQAEIVQAALELLD